MTFHLFMHRFFLVLFIVLFFLFFISPVVAQESSVIKRKDLNEQNLNQNKSTQEKTNEKDSKENPRTKFIPIPIIFFSPETQFGFGLTFIHLDYRDKSENASVPRTSSAVLLYTTLQQFLSAISFKDLLANEKILLQLSGAFSNFPKKYYGIGGETDIADEEAYLLQKEQFLFAIQYQIMSKFFIGPAMRAFHYTINDKEANSLIERSGFSGTDRAVGLGFGLNIDVDWRDNNFLTRRGFFSRTGMLMYPNPFNQNVFNEFLADLRAFFSLPWKDVLALQFYSHIVNQSPPIMLLPELGGANVLRGYYQGRYRDRVYAALQLEYRLLVFYPFGLVLFGAAGEVTDCLKEVTMDKIKIAGGFGLRYFFKGARGVGLRLDFGFSRDDNGFYLNFLEAF